ncbi:MAG: alkaline phosphatase [Enterobacterales bacterium]|jgi:alkaline phosphatase
MNKYFLHLSILLLLSMTSSVELSADAKPEKIKNIILIIGDGMGPGQIALLEAYARQSSNPVVANRTTAFSRMLNEGGVLGVSMTYAAQSLTTDSAASATQLALGAAAHPETIGADARGDAKQSVLAIAKQLGKSTGLVSDVRLTHSTPSAFAAHQPHRTMENEIAVDMLVTAPDVMLSGGLRHWIPKQANDKNSAIYKQLQEMTSGAIHLASKRNDQLNLLSQAQEQGYKLAFTKQQLLETDDSKTKGPEKILGLFSYSQFPSAIAINQLKKDVNRTLPTLKEMSEKAISILEKNDKGFFLMIEAGLIDWAAHDNDTGTMLHEMLKINETMEMVLDWAEKRDDTLVIVTADHETGGFGFSYSASNIPEARDLPGTVFKDRQYKSNYNFGQPSILDKLYNQKLSYGDIFRKEFDTLNTEQQTPTALMNIINQNTDFDITEQQAARILETEYNKHYVDGHRSLSDKMVPKFDVNDAFFVYNSENRRNLLAIEVAEQQSVVWSNDTHTSTPVLVFVQGQRKTSEQFIQFMGHPELGQKIINIIKNQ